MPVQPILYRMPSSGHLHLPTDQNALKALSNIGMPQGGMHQIRPGYEVGRPEHPFHYHVLVVRGRIRYRILDGPEERCGEIGPGECWQCPQHIPYSIGSDGDGLAIWWSLLPEAPLHRLRRECILPKRPLMKRIPPLMRWLHHDLQADDVSTATTIRAGAEMLAVAIETVSNGHWQALGEMPRRSLKPLWQAVYRQPHLPWTLDDLAERCDMSRYQLTRIMKKTYGCPPMVMVTRLRMQRCEELLRSSKVTLDTLAEQLGYATGFALSKAFKNHSGMSPRAFRTLHTT